MSELNYKELQERGIFDVPYRAFKYMQSQQDKIDLLEKELTETQAFLNKQNHIKQAKIDELQKKLDCCQEENKAHLEKIDEAWNELDDRNSKEYIIENLEKILKGNKDEN